jgi:hypothetical protein
MNYCDDQDNRDIKNIENGVRESAEQPPPKRLVYDRIHLRIVEDGGVNPFQLILESHRQVRRDIARVAVSLPFEQLCLDVRPRPRRRGVRVVRGQTPVQLLAKVIVHRHDLGDFHKAVPDCFDELQAFGWRECQKLGKVGHGQILAERGECAPRPIAATWISPLKVG